MKNNIRFLALALAGILALGGCSSQEASKADEESNETIEFGGSGAENGNAEETKETSNEQADEGQAQTDESAETLDAEAGQAEAPAVSIKQSERREIYDDTGKVLIVTESHAIVEITSDGFDALKNTVEGYYGKDNTDTLDGMTEEAQNHLQGMKELEDYDVSQFPTYYMDKTASLERSDSSVISFSNMDYEYWGGAHGNYATYGYTVDVESGSELKFEDIIADMEGFRAEAVPYVTDKLDEDYGDGLFPEYAETVGSTFGGEYEPSWFLNATGIVIVFQTYEVGPYVMGQAVVTLPYSQFGKYMNEKYLAPKGELVAGVSANMDMSAFLGESGEVSLNSINNEYDASEVLIVAGTASEQVSTGYFQGAYVVRNAQGRIFMIVSADKNSFVYEITGGNITKCDELVDSRVISENVGTDKLSFSVDLNILGTYFSNMIYKLTDDGNLEQTEEIFYTNIDKRYVTLESLYVMTVMKELPVVQSGGENKLAVGTKLYITGTNNKDKAYFEIVKDDGKGGIEFTGDNGEIDFSIEQSGSGRTLYIDGVSEYEYFGKIPYMQ